MITVFQNCPSFIFFSLSLSHQWNGVPCAVFTACAGNESTPSAETETKIDVRIDEWMDWSTDGYYVNDTDNFITAFNDSNAKKKKRFFWRPAHRSIVSFLLLRTRTRVIMIRSMQFAMQRAILTRSFISWIMYLYFLYIWRLIGRPLPVQKKKCLK